MTRWPTWVWVWVWVWVCVLETLGRRMLTATHAGPHMDAQALAAQQGELKNREFENELLKKQLQLRLPAKTSSAGEGEEPAAPEEGKTPAAARVALAPVN